MSNKTDLQALNANYEALIEELRGKAVGGGSGGNVEYGWFSISGWVGYNDGSNDFTYKFPFEIGMTWGEWVTTPLNIRVFIDQLSMQQLHANGNQIYGASPSFGTGPSGTGYPLCSSTALSDAVTLSNTIINGATYYINHTSSGGGGYD